jgi:hypothetical protein
VQKWSSNPGTGSVHKNAEKFFGRNKIADKKIYKMDTKVPGKKMDFKKWRESWIHLEQEEKQARPVNPLYLCLPSKIWSSLNQGPMSKTFYVRN